MLAYTRTKTTDADATAHSISYPNYISITSAVMICVMAVSSVSTVLLTLVGYMINMLYELDSKFIAIPEVADRWHTLLPEQPDARALY